MDIFSDTIKYIPYLLRMPQPVEIDLVSTLWVLLAGILVFLMIPAIGMLEAGLIRRKNVINGLMKGLLAVMVFFPVWFAVFPLYFGDLLTEGYYLLDGGGIPGLIYAFFLGTFGAVTLALIFAGIPERVRFGGWIAFSVFFSAVQWPLIASWVWGGGLLATLGDITGLAPGLGLVDFAGGTVVHAYAGIASLAALMVIGPTIRRMYRNGGAMTSISAREEVVYKEYIEMRSVNLPLAIIGTALLYFGWFGFNGGSALSVSVQTSYAIANTAIAGALGGIIAVALQRALDGTWGPVMAISGIIGGLVMVTPLAGFVGTATAFLVGPLAGIVTYFGLKAVEKWYVIDDPVGSFPVHGFNGIVGSMLVPVLSDPSIGGLAGLIFGGPPGWIATQLIGMAIALGLVFVTTYVLFLVLTRGGFRVRPEEEIAGLDVVDHGTKLEEI